MSEFIEMVLALVGCLACFFVFIGMIALYLQIRGRRPRR